MSSGSPQYEFSNEQNVLFGSLAHKMRWVGLFFVAVGVLNLFAAALLLVAIYQHKLPSDWVQKLSSEVQTQLQQLPPNHQLWGALVSSGLSGVVYLLIGVWTRKAARSFQQIVDTRGRDISLLMNALSALHSQYNLIYTLLMLAVAVFVLAVGLALINQFFG